MDVANPLVVPVLGRARERFAPRWQLRERLSISADAELFDAVDASGRRAAVKLRAPTELGSLSWYAERWALARIDHPSVARVLDATADPRPLLALELHRGARRLADVRRERPGSSRHWAEEALEALAAIHLAGVALSTIDLTTLLVDTHDRVRVTGFGSAQELTETTGARDVAALSRQLLGLVDGVASDAPVMDRASQLVAEGFSPRQVEIVLAGACEHAFRSGAAMHEAWLDASPEAPLSFESAEPTRKIRLGVHGVSSNALG